MNYLKGTAEMTHDSTQHDAGHRGSFGRRRFLAGAAGMAAAGALAACGGGSDDDQGTGGETIAGSTGGGASTTAGGSSASGGGSSIPTYVPYTGVKPDLPAGEHGVPAGFYHYPSNPVTFTSGVPGKGGKLNIMTQATSIATPEDKNSWWQGINKALGVDIQLHFTPSADYLQKFQVTIAGGLQDDIALWQTVANTPGVLAKDFCDLTPYLAGDAIKEYPGLASIPTATWQYIPTINGKIWGIPQPRNPAGNIASTRGDLLEKFGIKENSPVLNSGQEFLDLCKQLTDKKGGKYAIGEQPNSWVLAAMLEMMEAPNLNGWAQTGGKFTSVNEMDQMKDAITQVKTMWDAGYIHPDSFTTPGQNFTWWSGGITTIYFQNVAGWGYANTYPDWNMGVIILPKWNGGGAARKNLGLPGYGAFAAFKKADDARIKELLAICNYIAAPFGTKEYLLINYGVENVDYTIKDGDPIKTDKGKTETPSGLSYVGGQSGASLYFPGNKALVDVAHEHLTKVLPTGYADPTWGLYSETNSTKGATANKTLSDASADIIQGRKSISDWDDLVSSWRKAAGDAMRSEYEEAYANSNS
jgi:putative aldouronate transport system substrate-binding protein